MLILSTFSYNFIKIFISDHMIGLNHMIGLHHSEVATLPSKR